MEIFDQNWFFPWKLYNLLKISDLNTLFYNYLEAHLRVLSRFHVWLGTGRDASLKNLLHFSNQVNLWAGYGDREDSLDVKKKREENMPYNHCVLATITVGRF